ncbi:MAG: hypothetical protein L3K02_08765, partial [Thermoplasmata archaeon]|nr:hypothetical protein [Thermoplasmata archaeon]
HRPNPGASPVKDLEGSLEVARQLHVAAHQRCFVANSVNFPVHCEPVVERPSPAADVA